MPVLWIFLLVTVLLTGAFFWIARRQMTAARPPSKPTPPGPRPLSDLEALRQTYRSEPAPKLKPVSEGEEPAAIHWGMALVLMGMVVWFIGFGQFRSWRVEVEQLRHVVHEGYYVKPGGTFTFVAPGRQGGFRHRSLGRTERLDFVPAFNASSVADSFEVVFTHLDRPLRLDGRAVNLPETAWMTSGDPLVVTRTDSNGNHTFTLRWTKDTQFFAPFERVVNTFTYRAEDDSTETFLSNLVLRDGLPLGTLVRLRSGNPVFWDRLQERDTTTAFIFEHLRWIRERQGNEHARLGVLIADTLLRRADLRFSIGGVPITRADTPHRIRFSQETRVAYGLNRRTRLLLDLPRQSVFDPVFKNVMEARLVHPTRWSLPPNPDAAFVVGAGPNPMATPETRTRAWPIDGYHVDAVDLPHPLYAKVHLSDDRNALHINDGRRTADANLLPAGVPFRLGDFDQGVTFALNQHRPTIRFAGLWALGLLLLHTMLFHVLLRRTWTGRQTLRGALWTVFWCLMLTILTVRLILAYRVGLLPPADATPALVALFGKSLTVSLGALALIPPGLLAVRYGPALWPSLRNWRFEPSATWVVVWLTGLGVWLLLCLTFGSNEAFLGARINISTHLLIVLGLVVLAKPITQLSRWAKAGVGLALLVVLAVVTFGIGDMGSVLHFTPLLLVLVTLALWHRPGRSVGRVALAAVPVVVAVVLFWLPSHLPAQTMQGVLRFTPIQAVVQFVPDHVFYRMATIHDNELDVLALDEDETGLTGYLANSQQSWQMLLYAAEGAHDPVGFGQAPLSRTAMTYPTSLTDCLFAIYVLAEHGAWAGVLLVLLYIGLCGICFYASWILPDDKRHRALPLAVIGGFFGFNALYMASANVGLVLFTGQNIPLLGIYSISDVIGGAVLLMAAVGLMDFGNETPATIHADRAEATAERVFLGGLAAGLVMLAVGLVTMPETYRDDYTFVPQVFAHFQANVGPNNEAWFIEGDRLRRRPGVAVPPVEQELAREFNLRPDKYEADGGALYLRSVGSRSLLAFNSQYYRLTSPFRLRADRSWRGTVVAAGGQAAPFFAGFDGLGEAEDYFALRRNGPYQRLFPKSGLNTFVNGERVTESVVLNPMDLITLEGTEAGRVVNRRSVLYFGDQPPVLSTAIWRNDRYEAFYPGDGLASLLYSLRRVSARQREGGDLPDTLALTFDPILQRRLQADVAAYARTRPSRYAENDPLHSSRIALTVLDPFTGEVLALPSWPTIDPDTRAFRELLQQTDRSDAQERLLTNHNLTRQSIGSTIKPLLFATVARGLSDAFDVRRLTTHERFSEHPDSVHQFTRLAGIRMRTPWTSRVHTDKMVEADEFLFRSNNFYVGELGMLSMLIEPDSTRLDARTVLNRSGIFRPVSRQSDQYTVSLDLSGGRQYFEFDVSDLNPSPFTRHGPVHELNDRLRETLLFRYLPDLFSVYVDPVNLDSVKTTQRAAFLPVLTEGYDPKAGADWMQRVVPEPIVFEPDRMRDVRNDLVSFFLGSGQSRWNAVHMAEAMARLATGKRVTATLQPRDGVVFDELPYPLGNGTTRSRIWRNAHILGPMEEVWRQGTIAAGSPKLNRMGREYEGVYRMVFKTGTVDEGRSSRESESLMFVIGRWEGTATDGAFVPGQTVAGYLYMQDAKVLGSTIQKFGLVEPLMETLIAYLQD